MGISLRGTGILWQGSHVDVQEIQHLLAGFDAYVSQSGMQLGIIFEGSTKPVIVNLGDEVVLNEFDQFAVLPAVKN